MVQYMYKCYNTWMHGYSVGTQEKEQCGFEEVKEGFLRGHDTFGEQQMVP